MELSEADDYLERDDIVEPFSPLKHQLDDQHNVIAELSGLSPSVDLTKNNF